MDYFVKISTPTQTLQTDPLITTIELTRGRLLTGYIIFPTDSAYSLHVAFYISSIRLAPWNRESDYMGHNCKIDIFFDQDLHHQPHRIHIVTWNDSLQIPITCLIGLHFDPFTDPRSTKTFEELARDLVPGYVKGTERNAVPEENTLTFYKP